jgi:hypothetical protein
LPDGIEGSPFFGGSLFSGRELRCQLLLESGSWPQVAQFRFNIKAENAETN